MYAILIKKFAPDANPRWVEAWMRLKHSALDDLTIDRFKHDLQLALACIVEATPEQSEGLAKSYGL